MLLGVVHVQMKWWLAGKGKEQWRMLDIASLTRSCTRQSRVQGQQSAENHTRELPAPWRTGNLRGGRAIKRFIPKRSKTGEQGRRTNSLAT